MDLRQHAGDTVLAYRIALNGPRLSDSGLKLETNYAVEG